MRTWQAGGLAAAMVLFGAAASLAEDEKINYDEAKVPTYTLPDPLLKQDGTRVTTATEWPSRRAELVKLFEENVYGQRLPAPKNLR